MKCPSCPDTTLVMSDRQGVEIDYCPQCRGVWLDRGELDKLIERAAYDDQPSWSPDGLRIAASLRNRATRDAGLVTIDVAEVRDVLRVPINHFEGNYVCDTTTLEQLRADARLFSVEGSP